MIPIGDAAQVPGAIKLMRANAHLNQRQLAAMAGTTQSAICDMERGCAVPVVSTLLRVADALGYDLALIRREDA